MEQPGRDAEEPELEVSYFELVAAGATLTLLRLGGRWAGVEAADLEPATLVVEADGQEHRLAALPEAQGAAPADDEAPWRAAFAAPAALAAARSTIYALDVGLIVSLPRPYERRLGRPPTDAAAEQAVPDPPATPEPAVPRPPVHRRIGPRVVVVAILVVVVLLVVVAAATSGDEEGGGAAMPPGAEPVALLHVLTTGRAAGRVVREPGGRLVVRATGLDGRRSGVWLFNSVIDARLIGTIEGHSGQVVLPTGPQLRRFGSIDVSREDDANPNHSGRSVLRVATASVR